MDLGLAGKKAIIVGGARGIGYAVAEVLAREGADVAICARGEDAVKDAVANLRKYGTKVFGASAHVQRPEEYKAWLEAADEELGGTDILIPIPSAGSGFGSEKHWQRAYEVDLMGPVRAVDVIVPKMAERESGSVVLVATTSALEAMGGPQPYNALKGSLIIWGKQLALAHGKDGIRVNVVSPGPVEFEGGNWEMIKGTMEKFYNNILRQQPMGRFGKPEEIARAIVFLASPAASWCSGSHLVVDGAYTNRTHF